MAYVGKIGDKTLTVDIQAHLLACSVYDKNDSFIFTYVSQHNKDDSIDEIEKEAAIRIKEHEENKEIKGE